MNQHGMRPVEALRRANRRLSDHFEATSEITLAQALFLGVLLPGPKSQVEIVRLTGMDRSTVGEMVRRIHRLGLIKAIAKSPTSRRETVITIEEAGRVAVRKADKRLLAAERKMLGFVPPGAREAFLQGLRAIAGAE